MNVLEREKSVGVVFCEQWDSEFTNEGEKKKQRRNILTFDCDFCKLRLKNKEELDMHFLTCEIYLCFKCQYRHKRENEMKNNCRTEHEK